MPSHFKRSYIRKSLQKITPPALVGTLMLQLITSQAHALPAYARQTGQDCAACHVGGYGPELTPYGIKFKLGGYTDTDGKEGKIPLSGMIQGSFAHTSKDQDVAPSAHNKVNNNFALDEASLFVAGRLMKSLGAFAQITYDGVSRKGALDNLDLRYAHTLDIDGKETTVGLSLNNSPSLQDPFNTMPAWRFPYMGSSMTEGVSPSASPLINGGIEHRVLGVSAYGFWNNSIYLDVGTYRSLSPSFQSDLGLGRDEDPGRLGSSTLYWRAAYFNDMKKHNYSLGLFGLNADIQPRNKGISLSDRYQDIGIDGKYQYMGTKEHIASVFGSYTWERQKRAYLVSTAGASNPTNRLKELRLGASYHYKHTWGLTLSRFAVQGTSDSLQYADGFANGSPNSSGYMLQGDWTPWGKEDSWKAPLANLRVGIQYIKYDKFNGAKTNYDGNGRNASDNNTLSSFVSTSF